jgi:hypothetical protein
MNVELIKMLENGLQQLKESTDALHTAKILSTMAALCKAEAVKLVDNLND